MNEVVHRIKLDVTKQGTQARIKVKKGDTGTRKLKIMLVNGSLPYEPEAASVAIYADIGNATIFNACELYGNIVTVVLPNGMISAAGTVECELRLQDGANVLFSPKFEVAVEDTICDDSALEATNEYTALTEAIADAQALHNGYTFTPSVDADGNLSWSNDGGLANPETTNIRGPEGPAGDGHEHSNKAALDQINIENGKVSFGSNSKLGLGDKLLIDASGNYCDITGGTAGDVLRIGDGNLLYNGKNIPFSSDIPTVDNAVTATGTNPVSGKAVAEYVAANLPTVDNTVTADGANPVSGAAVAAYVAANAGNETWELIADVTLTEEVAELQIFSGTTGYKKISGVINYVVPTTNTATANKELSIYTDKTNKSNPMCKVAAAMCYNADRCSVFFTSILKDYCISYSATNVPDAGAWVQSYMNYATWHNTQNYIKSLSLFGWGAYFGIGSTIKIYGVRA